MAAVTAPAIETSTAFDTVSAPTPVATLRLPRVPGEVVADGAIHTAGTTLSRRDADNRARAYFRERHRAGGFHEEAPDQHMAALLLVAVEAGWLDERAVAAILADPAPARAFVELTQEATRALSDWVSEVATPYVGDDPPADYNVVTFEIAGETGRPCLALMSGTIVDYHIDLTSVPTALHELVQAVLYLLCGVFGEAEHTDQLGDDFFLGELIDDMRAAEQAGLVEGIINGDTKPDALVEYMTLEFLAGPDSDAATAMLSEYRQWLSYHDAVARQLATLPESTEEALPRVLGWLWSVRREAPSAYRHPWGQWVRRAVLHMRDRWRRGATLVCTAERDSLEYIGDCEAPLSGLRFVQTNAPWYDEVAEQHRRHVAEAGEQPVVKLVINPDEPLEVLERLRTLVGTDALLWAASQLSGVVLAYEH